MGRLHDRALHTAGSLLGWHPHLHVIALDGGVLDDGHYQQLTEVDTARIQELFAERVFESLLAEQLIDLETVESMKLWPNSGFSFYAGEPVAPTDTEARLFLARYLKKAPLSLERLTVDETGPSPKVVYKNAPSSIHPDELRRYSPLEFLAELSLHIPRVFEQTTRWYGLYSPYTRGASRGLPSAEEVSEERASTPNQPVSANWARCIKRVFELDPLRCPKCSSPMKIRSFLLNSREIDRLCRNLGLTSWRAPPPLSSRLQATQFETTSYSYLN